MAFKDTFFSGNTSFNCRGRLVQLPYPAVMGIINLTPDSFYSGSRFHNGDEVLKRTEEMILAGVSIIDIGACSTRPGSIAPTEKEEENRLLPTLHLLRKKFPEIVLSVDTWRASIAYKSIADEGADMINDISAGRMDPTMINTVAACKVPYVLMHMQGTPDRMQLAPHYDDIINEVLAFFREKVGICQKAGIHDLIIDPGFGFGKTPEQNYYLLSRLQQFDAFGFPVMVGVSRKSMIYKILDTSPEKALNGTSVLHTLALLMGAQILRVHDEIEALETVRLMKFYFQCLNKLQTP